MANRRRHKASTKAKAAIAAARKATAAEHRRRAAAASGGSRSASNSGRGRSTNPAGSQCAAAAPSDAAAPAAGAAAPTTSGSSSSSTAELKGRRLTIANRKSQKKKQQDEQPDGQHDRRKQTRADLVASNLPQLQNWIRRDPQSYREEFLLQWRHWDAARTLVMEHPAAASASSAAGFASIPSAATSVSASPGGHDLSDLIQFLAHVAYCYPKEAADYPNQLIDLLSAHYRVLNPDLRRSMVQALILLRNKNLVPTTSVLSLFFTLFRVQDKELRKLLQSHIVTDIKNANAKAKNNKLNKTLQNFMYTMLEDTNETAARKSLEVMMELYHKNIWNDAKTVNVLAEACFSPHPKIVAAAVHFFLSSNQLKKKDEDEDDDVPDMDSIRHKLLINKKSRSSSTLLEKAKAAVKRRERGKNRAETFNFSALHLLNDPQGFAEKLFTRLRAATTASSKTPTLRFELRLNLLNLVSRLIGVHKLLLLGFYDHVLPYLRPSQRDVTSILAYVAQASHELVPPDVMGTVVETIADEFVWGNAAGEVVAAGLNGLREICARCPLAMSETLLQSLVDDYKNHRDKSAMMAGRSLLALYREINPELLRKKDRGKGANVSMKEFKRPVYGEVRPAEAIDGIDLLLEDEVAQPENGEDDPNPGDGWEGWEVESLPDSKKKKKKNKGKEAAVAADDENAGKASAKVLVVNDDGEEVEVADEDEDGWEDEDDEDGDDDDEGNVGSDMEDDGSDDGDEEVEDDDNDDNEGEEGGDGDDDGEDDASDEVSMTSSRVTATSTASGGPRVGPKQQKLQMKRQREETLYKAEASPAKKQKLIQLSSERIYTDEDFARMRELAANRRAERMAGVHKSHAQRLMEEQEAEEEDGVVEDPATVDIRRITAGLKKKATYADRVASVQAGREGREKFGSRKGMKRKLDSGGSLTNREKSKTTKNPMMLVHKRSVVQKAMRSTKDKARVQRAHIERQKKKGH